MANDLDLILGAGHSAGVPLQRVIGAVELRIAGCPRPAVEIAEAESVRRLEPARLQGAEVIVMEHGLSLRESGPGSRRNVVAQPLRGCAQPVSVIVDRPAEIISGDEQARSIGPLCRARRYVRAERETPQRGCHPRSTSR